MDPPKKRKRSKDEAAERPEKSRRKKKEASLNREASGFPNHKLLIFRLAVSAVLFAFVLIGTLPSFAELLLLLAGCAVSGYDLAIDSVRAVLRRDFTDSSLAVFFAALVSFPIGFGVEGLALIILYQALKMLVTLAAARNSNAIFDKIDPREENLRFLVQEELKQEDASEIRIASMIESSVKPVFLMAMVAAFVLALIMAVFLHYNLRVAVHRAITMIVVLTPYSILASMPVIGSVSLGYAAGNGTVFRRAADLEILDGTKTVILEKSCFPEPEAARILSYSSSGPDDHTFLMLVRHLLHGSEQPFARIILDSTDSRMMPELISDFSESPGGVEAVINGSRGYFGTRSYLNGMGINPPESGEEKGIAYYLYFAGRYGGKILLSEGREEDVSDLVHDLRYAGINRCVLLSSESAEEVSDFSSKSDFDDVFAGISTENRLGLINEICQANNHKTLCVRSVTFDERSTADVEIRVGENIDDADAATLPHYFTSIPVLFPISRRIREIATENTVLVFGVKAVLVFLSLIGYSNLWISISIDMAAALVAVMNANRVTTRSLLKIFFNR